MGLASVNPVGCIKRRRRRVALDDKAALAPGVVALEDLEQFGIYAYIAFGIVRFRAIELGRLDPYHAFVEAERGPGQHIDFVSPQARQSAEQEDLVFLRPWRGQFLPGAFEQFRQVEGCSGSGRRAPSRP